MSNPEIKEFSVQLESNKIEKSLKGQVLLDLVEPLLNIESIHIRFVGGIKTSHKTLVGYDKLFDSKIELVQVSNLEPKEHIFDFQVSIPENIPNFMNCEVKVEYLLICVIGFQNGCCGLIPILQRDPVSIKQELHFLNLDLLDTFDLRLGSDMKLIDVDGIDYLIWNPKPFILIKMNPLQTINNWSLRLQLDLDYVLDKVEYSVYEQSLIKYDMDTESHKLVKLEKDGKVCLSSGVITDIPIGTLIQNERQFELLLHLLLDSKFMDVIPDIHCESAIVSHLVKLDCFVYPKEQVAGHSVPIKITGILPIQIYPQYDDSILIVHHGSQSTISTVVEEEDVTIRKRK